MRTSVSSNTLGDLRSKLSGRKKVRSVLGQLCRDTRQTIGNERVRSFKFAPLADCRRQFAIHAGGAEHRMGNKSKRASAFR